MSTGDYIKAGGVAFGTGVSVYGKIKGARAQLDADRATAELMRRQAEQTIVRGREESSALISNYISSLNENTADLATRNIDVNGDVARIVQNQTIEASRLDSDKIKANALADAQSLREQASNIIDASEAQYHGAIISGSGESVAAAASLFA